MLKMPERITYYHSKKSYPYNCVEAANKMFDLWESYHKQEVIKERLKEIEHCAFLMNQTKEVARVAINERLAALQAERSNYGR